MSGRLGWHGPGRSSWPGTGRGRSRCESRSSRRGARSREWNVAADHIELSYVRDPDLETAADPQRHAGAPAPARAPGRAADQRHPDRCRRGGADPADRRPRPGAPSGRGQLAPGFSYAEELGRHQRHRHRPGGRPAGPRLRPRALRRAPGGPGLRRGPHPPPHHRQDGRRVDLTCWRKNADPLLIALVKTTAEQITQALLTDASAQELELLQDYLRACRRTSGIVLAHQQRPGHDERARPAASWTPATRPRCSASPAEALAGGSPGGDGRAADRPAARMHCRPVRGRHPDQRRRRAREAARGRPAAVASAQAAAQGHGCSCPAWSGRACCGCAAAGRCRTAYESGEWLALEGEAGVGKLALARAVHQRRNPAGPVPRAGRRRRDRRGLAGRAPAASCWPARATLVIRHVDQLATRQAARAGRRAAGGPRRPAGPHLVGGRHAEPQADARADLTELLRLFPATVELPPLRHHIEDLPELAPFFLARLSQHGRLSLLPGGHAAADAVQLAGQRRASCGRCCARSCSAAGRA